VTEPLWPDERLFLEVVGERPLYRADGCDTCKGTGYLGRQPVTEIVEMTPEFRKQLAAGHSDLSNLRDLIKGSLSSLSHGAAMRVISGDTTAGEATRVIGQRFWNDLAREFGRDLQPGAVTSLVRDDDSLSADVGALLFGADGAARQAIAASLEESAIHVHVTDNPEMVRRVIEKNEGISLGIIDLEVGVDVSESAIDLLVRLRRALAWSRLPVLIIAPARDLLLQKILEEHGVADYLVKPVSPETILARVQAILAR
jgi:CheY-like chemotaxis protein